MTITPRQSAGLATSSAVAGASTLLISVIAARSLGSEAAFKEFTVFWSLFFAVVGVMTGVQQEATRATSRPERRTGGRLAAVGALVGAAASVMVGGALIVAHDRLLSLTHPSALAALTVGIAIMALYQTFLGCAAGSRRWWGVTALISVDAVTRIVLVVIAAAWIGSLAALQWAVVLAGVSWVPFLVCRSHRRVFGCRGDAPAAALVRNSAWTLLSAGALAVLTTGFAALLQFSTPAGDARRLAIVMTVVTVTRTALLLPLQAFQGVILARFSDTPSEALFRELRRFLAIVTGLGVVVAVPAWFLGPPVIGGLFGRTYTPAPMLVTGLWLAAVPLAWLLLTGQVALAASRHRAYAMGWVTAALVTAGTLLLALPLETRVVVALVLGPVLGALVHVGTGLSHRRRSGAARHPRSDTPR